MSQIFVAEPAAQAVLGLAVGLLQLEQGLRVGRILRLESAFMPGLDHVIAFGRQLLQQIEGAFTQFFVQAVAAVGKQQRGQGVDEQQVDGFGAQPFADGLRGGPEVVVCQPLAAC